jgi:hypothetical protein
MYLPIEPCWHTDAGKLFFVPQQLIMHVFHLKQLALILFIPHFYMVNVGCCSVSQVFHLVIQSHNLPLGFVYQYGQLHVFFLQPPHSFLLISVGTVPLPAVRFCLGLAVNFAVCFCLDYAVNFSVPAGTIPLPAV